MKKDLAVVSYRNSTSNHNAGTSFRGSGMLYLIEILHQTTTSPRSVFSLLRCILSKFYIKPQHSLRYFECFVVVSYRNSTSNHNSARSKVWSNKVVSYRNSTSNHNPQPIASYPHGVVSYRNSTSNHNILGGTCYRGTVVSYRNSTSNHNLNEFLRGFDLLYLIEILHQTTTSGKFSYNLKCCILSKFYIKPQLKAEYNASKFSCILSKFYIKPQRLPSNSGQRYQLYLIEILHQTTTMASTSLRVSGCILSKFYIKPQRRASY